MKVVEKLKKIRKNFSEFLEKPLKDFRKNRVNFTNILREISSKLCRNLEETTKIFLRKNYEHSGNFSADFKIVTRNFIEFS